MLTSLKKRGLSNESRSCKTVFATLAIIGSLFIIGSAAGFGHQSVDHTGMMSASSHYQFSRTPVGPRSEKYTLTLDGGLVSYEDFLLQLAGNSEFRTLFTNVLMAVEYPAYLFETPAVSIKTLQTVSFEFVVTDSHSLAQAETDDSPFKDFFAACEGDVTSFMSLGGDARLVVPCPASSVPKTAYTHLAQFVRNAPRAQIENIWMTVSSRVLQRLTEPSTNDKDLWFSTNGNGVSWLHVRLDTRPKYYAHGPYRQPSSHSLR
jgi:hypothetical protein